MQEAKDFTCKEDWTLLADEVRLLRGLSRKVKEALGQRSAIRQETKIQLSPISKLYVQQIQANFKNYSTREMTLFESQ